MSFAADLLPTWLNLLLGIAMLVTLGLAIRFADWPAITSVPARLHLLFGCSGFCLLLWLLSADLDGAVRIHLLGMTAITLILGLRFALLSGSAALLALLWLIDRPMISLPGAWLCTVAVPAVSSRVVVSQLARIRRQNLFMYTLGGGFAGGMLATLATACTALLLLWLAGQQSLLEQGLANWPLVTLVIFPEGFINGMLLTAVCVYHPGIVKTFDDRTYIDEA
jgi:uncharacterized membrane protein